MIDVADTVELVVQHVQRIRVGRRDATTLDVFLGLVHLVFHCSLLLVTACIPVLLGMSLEELSIPSLPELGSRLYHRNDYHSNTDCILSA